MAVSVPTEEMETLRATCSVIRWRGYASSRFVALADDAAVAESPPFRWRGKGEPPADGAPAEAYAALAAALEALGWEADEADGGAWYERSFSRPLTAEELARSHELEAEPAVAAVPAEPVVLQAPPPAPKPAPVQVAPIVAHVVAPVARPVAPVRPAPVEAPAPAPARERRRPRWLMPVSILGGLVAVVAAAYSVFAAPQRTRTVVVTVTTPALRVPAPARHAPVPVRRPAAVTRPVAASAPLVRLSISAGERASWLEIRRGSSTGRILYAAELAPGGHVHVSGSRLWTRFGAAGNVTVVANGRRVPLLGTIEHTFVAAR